MAFNAGGIESHFNVNVVPLVAGLKKAKKELADLDREFRGVGASGAKGANTAARGVDRISKSAKIAEKNARALGKALTAAGLVTGVGLKKSIQSFAAFEDGLTRAASVASKSRADFQGVFSGFQKAAEDTAVTTRFTAKEMSGALTFLAMAGNDAKTSIEALPKVAQLAAIGMNDLAVTADQVTNIMTSFGLSSAQLGDVNNILVGTTTNANLDLLQLGESIQQTGALSKGLGLSLQEVSTALGVLSFAGRRGEEAGTGINRAILQMANASPKGKKALDQLGVSIQDLVDGGFGQLIEKLEESKKEFDTIKFTSLLGEAFGKIGIKTISALVEQGADKFYELGEAINFAASENRADFLEGEQLKTLSGETIKLISEIEVIQHEIANIFLPALKDGIFAIKGFVNAFKELPDGTKQAIAYGALAFSLSAVYSAAKLMIGLGPGFGVLSKNMVGLSSAMKAVEVTNLSVNFSRMGTEMATMIGGGSKLTSVFTKMLATLKPLSIAAGVFAAGFAGFRLGQIFDQKFGTSNWLADLASDIFHVREEMEKANSLNVEGFFLDLEVILGGINEEIITQIKLNEELEMSVRNLIGEQQDVNQAYLDGVISMGEYEDATRRVKDEMVKTIGEARTLAQELQSLEIRGEAFNEKQSVVKGLMDQRSEVEYKLMSEQNRLNNAGLFSDDRNYAINNIKKYEEELGRLNKAIEAAALQPLIDFQKSGDVGAKDFGNEKSEGTPDTEVRNKSKPSTTTTKGGRETDAEAVKRLTREYEALRGVVKDAGINFQRTYDPETGGPRELQPGLGVSIAQARKNLEDEIGELRASLSVVQDAPESFGEAIQSASESLNEIIEIDLSAIAAMPEGLKDSLNKLDGGFDEVVNGLIQTGLSENAARRRAAEMANVSAKELEDYANKVRKAAKDQEEASRRRLERERLAVQFIGNAFQDLGTTMFDVIDIWKRGSQEIQQSIKNDWRNLGQDAFNTISQTGSIALGEAFSDSKIFKDLFGNGANSIGPAIASGLVSMAFTVGGIIAKEIAKANAIRNQTALNRSLYDGGLNLGLRTDLTMAASLEADATRRQRESSPEQNDFVLRGRGQSEGVQTMWVQGLSSALAQAITNGTEPQADGVRIESILEDYFDNDATGIFATDMERAAAVLEKLAKLGIESTGKYREDLEALSDAYVDQASNMASQLEEAGISSEGFSDQIRNIQLNGGDIENQVVLLENLFSRYNEIIEKRIDSEERLAEAQRDGERAASSLVNTIEDNLNNMFSGRRPGDPVSSQAGGRVEQMLRDMGLGDAFRELGVSLYDFSRRLAEAGSISNLGTQDLMTLLDAVEMSGSAQGVYQILDSFLSGGLAGERNTVEPERDREGNLTVRGEEQARLKEAAISILEGIIPGGRDVLEELSLDQLRALLRENMDELSDNAETAADALESISKAGENIPSTFKLAQRVFESMSALNNPSGQSQEQQSEIDRMAELGMAAQQSFLNGLSSLSLPQSGDLTLGDNGIVIENMTIQYTGEGGLDELTRQIQDNVRRTSRRIGRGISNLGSL